MSEGVVVYGAGGHGKVIADALTASGQKVLAFIDDNVSLIGSTVLDSPIYSADEWLRSLPGAHVALGVGDNAAREQVAGRIKHCNCSVITVLHPRTVIARSAKIATPKATIIRTRNTAQGLPREWRSWPELC